MARTIQTIQDGMIASIQADPVLSGLTSTSAVAIWRLLTYVVAVAIWALENILDITMSQQTAYIKQIKIHSLTWYANYGKKFQFGSSLPWGEVDYDNSGLTDAQIEAQQVVKYCVCVKVPSGLMVKVAGLTGGNLAPISATAQTAFEAYMFRISAAGDNLLFKNQDSDSLKLNIQIFYDALIFDPFGQRLDGTANTPVQDAIDAFLKGMDFNTKFVPEDLVDALQLVEGVNVVDLQSAYTNYASTPYTLVPADGVVPDSGYLRILATTDLTLTFTIWQP